MDTQPLPPPATPTRSQPDWALAILFVLLAGAALYALYYAFGAQAMVNRKLSMQNNILLERLLHLETLQGDSVKADMLEELTQELEESRAQVSALITLLESVEKTTSAPAPIIELSAPPAGNTETLQQFLALKTALESGKPYADELSAASALPEVKSISETLQPAATNGLVTEAELREALEEWLEDHPATVLVEDPKLESFNAKLKGLLSIRRKQAAPEDAFATLRSQLEAEASLDVLLTSARGLSGEAREALDTWINTVAERQSVLASLRAAEMALLKPKP